MINRQEWNEVEQRPFGWFSELEGQLYVDTVSRHPHGIAVELGVFMGRSLSFIIPICKEQDITLYAIDVWDDTQYGQFQKNLERLNAKDIVKVIRMDSVEAANQFSDFSVDVVMVDTLHTYKQTRREILAWTPKIRVDGDILFHDYGVKEPKGSPIWNVKKAVDESFKETQCVGSLCHVKKLVD